MSQWVVSPVVIQKVTDIERNDKPVMDDKPLRAKPLKPNENQRSQRLHTNPQLIHN